jgi:hypothetical protein
MVQSQKETSKIKTLLEASNSFYQDLLGYNLKQTSLQQIPQVQWNDFTQGRGLNQNSSGVYLPRDKTAIIQEENPLSLFHEYFGHGLYCEQSLAGRKLVDLEKRLLEEEKQEFKERQFTLEDVSKFRKQNLAFQELDEFRKKNLSQYELFAIWSEYLLSGEYGLKEDFERKYDSLSNRNKEAVESMIIFSEQYGDLAAFYVQGLARRTTPKRVKRLLEDIYGKEAINDSKLILLTGSKKPFSDIDLFASSNYLKPVKNNWLDLVVFDEEDFERRTLLFETQITHSIMAGEFIAGDKGYFQQKRAQLQEQPITEEAIQHNLLKSEQEKKASQETKDEELKRVYASYSQTYLANALALRRGLRLFTKEDILSYLKRAPAEDDKPLQLQGG